MIVEFETTNQANDLGRLEQITENAKEFLETETITALADSGYFDSTDILKCKKLGTTCLVPNQDSKLMNRKICSTGISLCL